MRFYTLFFLATCLGWSSAIFAQSPLKIRGKVLEDASGNPLEFATVKLTDPESGTRLGGTTSDADGVFELAADERSLLIEVSFLGFEIWQDLYGKYGLLFGKTPRSLLWGLHAYFILMADSPWLLRSGILCKSCLLPSLGLSFARQPT